MRFGPSIIREHRLRSETAIACINGRGGGGGGACTGWFSLPFQKILYETLKG